MALELKVKSKENLKDINVYIEDTSLDSSEYFAIVDFPSYLGDGKSSIKVRGNSKNLEDNTEIDIEILDQSGRPVYWEISDIKDEDETRLISIWVYANRNDKYDTAPGVGEVIFVGTAANVPSNWVNRPNVRWSRRVPIRVDLPSPSKIVFDQTSLPKCSISASVETFVNIPSTSGSLNAVTASALVYYKKSTWGEQISIERVSGTSFNGEMLSGSVYLNFGSTTLFPRLTNQSQPTRFTSSISEVYSNNVLRITSPITQSDNRSSKSIHTYDYSDGIISASISYYSTASYVATQNQVSFANITLTNLEPSVGRVYSINTLIKSKGLNGDYQIIGNTRVPLTGSQYFRVPIPTEHLNDPKTVKLQFLNINGEISDYSLIVDNIVFPGGNVYIAGNQSIITGSFFIGNTIGSGIELAGVSSGFLRSVGYEGQTSASQGIGPGGFIIYSGSGALQVGADTLTGVGMQLVGPNDNAHLIFSTEGGGSLDIKAEKFFIGTTGSQFISGSEGNIEISSSLFHLDPQNNLLIIGADAVINAGLSVNQLFTPATINGLPSNINNASSSITSQGFAKFVSASIGGWSVNTGSIFSTNLDINSSGKIQTRDFASGVKGWKIGQDGKAEFENISVRGTLKTTTFEKESVNAVGGQLYIANSTTLSGSAVTSLLTTSSSMITSSTSLPSGFGNQIGNDYVNYSGNNYLLVSKSDSTHFTIGTPIYANSATATLYYSQSNTNTSINVTSSREIPTTNYTTYQAEISLANDYVGGETQFDVYNYGNTTPPNQPTASFLGKSLKLRCQSGQIFTDGVDLLNEASGSILSISPPNITIGFDPPYTFDVSGATQNTIITMAWDSSSISYSQTSSNIVSTLGSTFPTDIAQKGQITFDAGGTTRSYKVLERIDSNNIKIDTSSIQAPLQTTYTSSVIIYSSSANTSVTITAGSQSNVDTLYATVSPSASIFVVDNVTGFVNGEILVLKKVNDTGFATEYVKVETSSRLDPSSGTNFKGYLYVTRSYGYGITGDSSSLGDAPAISQSYEAGQVLVSTGKLNTGFIRINANPNDQATPYMDIVERTGSGIYDVELKARLGDLSGLAGSNMVFGNANPGFGLATDNVYLQGGITATFGSIGGYGISTNTISSSNGNIILRDNGQITASAALISGSGVKIVVSNLELDSTNFKVKANGDITASNALLNGGVIGGFVLGSDIISSSNGALSLKSSGQITGSNVLLNGGVIGGFALNQTSISSSTQVVAGTPSLALKSNGQISGSEVLVRRSVNSTLYTLIDTTNGILDARNLGRQIVTDVSEYSVTNTDTNGYYYVSSSQYTVYLLPGENKMIFSYSVKGTKGGATSVTHGVQYRLWKSVTGSGLVNDLSAYDNWSGGGSSDAICTTAFTNTTGSRSITEYNTIVNIPDQYTGSYCRISLHINCNVVSGTQDASTGTFVKGLSIVTARGFAADYSGGQETIGDPPVGS